jgi:hypothetical protein
MKWNLGDLVFDYYPRNMWISHVNAFIYCDLTPNQSEAASIKQIPKDPSIVYTISPKNYNTNTDNYLAKYSDPDNYKFKIDNYGAQLKIVSEKINPIWLTYVTNNAWYFNQIKAYNISKYLKILPGVKNIYLTGSSTLEISKSSSDIDFIIQAHKGQVWIARFWVKVFLKILRLDVHDVILEYYIKQLHFLKSFNLIKLNFYTIKIKQIEDKIWSKKTRGGLIDTGLFYEQFEDIKKIFPKETRNFYIWAALGISNFSEQTDSVDFFGGDLSYWKNNSHLLSIFLLVTKLTLSLVSFILYPVLNLQYILYSHHKEQYIYFILKKNLICYFPIVFKPKSILEYQKKN